MQNLLKLFGISALSNNGTYLQVPNVKCENFQDSLYMAWLQKIQWKKF